MSAMVSLMGSIIQVELVSFWRGPRSGFDSDSLISVTIHNLVAHTASKICFPYSGNTIMHYPGSTRTIYNDLPSPFG